MTTIEHPDEYKEGVRILMLTLRSKDGGKMNNPDRVAVKLVSRNREEFDKCFEKLLALRKGEERIYSTVDQRSLTKGIRIFKYRQLDAEYFDKDSMESFYVDISNRWVSALQSPKARAECKFMVDVDYPKDDEEGIRQQIKDLDLTLLHEYNTKNGKHFILKPFNPKLVSFDVLQNHMMLWVY
jgi:hypothetical protein